MTPMNPVLTPCRTPTAIELLLQSFAQPPRVNWGKKQQQELHHPTASTATYNAVNVYTMCTVPKLIKYLHQACWSPTVDMWCKAIDQGYFATFPGLMSTAVRKHLPPHPPP